MKTAAGPSERPPGEVRLREVVDADLPILYEHQIDPDAVQMAAFPSRERGAFMAHWAKIMQDETVIARAILFDGQVAGQIGSWEMNGRRWVGYRLGKEYWGKGIATKALAGFLTVVTQRPLYATVVKHNVGSRRVLEKCGFSICDEPAEDETGDEFLLVLDSPDTTA